MMAAPEPGTEIDGFRLGERIHTGTMAWVYRLEGEGGTLPLIMKIPRLGAGEAAVNVVAFEVCRMVLGALAQGPHYPTLVAFGDVETTPYLVMEYIEGRRLAEWMERAPVAPEEIARLGAAFALALHEIHRQDVIHLDLKATNVIYRPDGVCALVDFGLAHHGHYPDLLAEEYRTPVGNWEYMAPEQVLGIRCDPRSDVFALGAMLYQLATGQLPFGRPRNLSQLRRRLFEEPRPPRALNPATPPWLQEIILHCLEPDNRKRYASAAEVAFDLAHSEQLALGERAQRLRAESWGRALLRRVSAGRFEPAPCPPLTTHVSKSPIVLAAVEFDEGMEEVQEAIRAATTKAAHVDARRRVACVTVVPPAAALGGVGELATATGRHMRYLVMLRHWARPLQLPEERVTFHVLESDKPAAALLDYADVNEVEHVVVGAPRRARAFRPGGIAGQLAAGARCNVEVVRPRKNSRTAE